MKTAAAMKASAMAPCLLCGTSAFTPQQSTISTAAARFVRAPSALRIPVVKTTRQHVRMAVAIPSRVDTRIPDSEMIDMDGLQLSGLNGLALKPKTFPTRREVIDVIPKHCFVKDTIRSMKYAVMSVSMTLAIGGLAAVFLPLKVRLRCTEYAHGVSVECTHACRLPSKS